ncbi:hypothetical protein OROMI_030757 [Orobanche minor]
MAKSKKLDQRSILNHHGIRLHKLTFGCRKAFKDTHRKKPVKLSEKREWKNALCSVCMEFPHSAVLLLCSSYESGCRPYMCATDDRFSNCLEQFKKFENEVPELLCPLCRGQVKGWTTVKPAREYLNTKKRTCTHDKCSFIGNYKDLRKHVKLEHPCARPHDMDPSRVKEWEKLENDRDHGDVLSLIRSTMPRATINGDYVIESDYSDYSSDDYESRRVRNNNSRNAGQHVGLLAGRRVGRLRGHVR